MNHDTKFLCTLTQQITKNLQLMGRNKTEPYTSRAREEILLLGLYIPESSTYQMASRIYHAKITQVLKTTKGTSNGE